MGCGLRSIKNEMPHGEWLPFLDDIGMKPDTARRFMRLAEYQIAQLVLFGSVDAALKALLKKRPRPESVCKIENCHRPAGVPGTTKDLCSAHYTRMQRHGSFDLPKRPEPVRLKACEFPGCQNQQRARGYCAAHWKRLHRYGDVNVTHRAPLWSPDEDAKLLDLPVYPISGAVLSGYLMDLAIHLERTDNAARSRLHRIRRIRRENRDKV